MSESVHQLVKPVPIMTWLASAIRLLAIVGWSAGCAALGVGLAFFSPDWPLDLARGTWAPLVLRILGVRVERLDRGDIDPNQPYVFVTNHQSMADIPVLLSQLPINVRFVAKHALARVPLLNLYMWRTRMIFVNRSDPTSAYRSLDRASERIRDGISVLVFAEGTRSRDGEIRPLKRGAFRMARKAGVPVVPIAIEGTRHVLPSGSLQLRPGRARVIFGEPIPSTGYPLGDEGVESMRSDLSTRVRQLHDRLLEPEAGAS